MQAKADFLIEIHTAELPPKALSRLAKNFLQVMEEQIIKAELTFKYAQFYATPRRLAVFVKALSAEQPTTSIERKGPTLDTAFDNSGNPTPACLGFARSCGVSPEELIRIKNKQGSWVGYQQIVPGKLIQELLPEIAQEAVSALSIPKRMRWGNHTVEFVRPVHSVLMLFGHNVIDAEILGVHTSRLTRGHRFHSKGWISIASPSRYLKALESKYVIADFQKRKEMIRQQAENIVTETLGINARVIITEELLDEVTGLVEWPVAIGGSFDEEFLTVPHEALISAMQDHQRYFPVVDQKGKLLPHFITISNIESKNVQQVISGNERVLRARLADAAFFFGQDKKRSLESRVDELKNIVYQAKLGTLHDKALRLAKLSHFIAEEVQANAAEAARAGLLAKTDLSTEIAGEFPDLQGIAGYYYALHDGETEDVAAALREQYQPRFSGDNLPDTTLGIILALADRLDTLVGVFGIHQPPTGEKDPFALRRAAVGVIRILVEKKLDLDLHHLLTQAAHLYGSILPNHEVIKQVGLFIQERLKPWYQDQGISFDVFSAVIAVSSSRIYDMHRRIQAVQTFKQLPDAESLSVANKRVSNILAKYAEQLASDKNIHHHMSPNMEQPMNSKINATLFETSEERELASQLKYQSDLVTPLYQSAHYIEVLTQLANLRKPVDDFFDKVMVMVEDKARRENRLLMLKKLRELFLQVADIALLQ